MTAPMQNKVTVRRVHDVFVISDEGIIAKLLGMEPTEWHQIAPTAALVGDRVERMERLIADALSRSGGSVISENPACLPQANSGAAVDDLDSLGLRPPHLARLRNALAVHGITRVSQLAGCTESWLREQRGIGPSIIKAIKKTLKSRGIRLAMRVHG